MGEESNVPPFPEDVKSRASTIMYTHGVVERSKQCPNIGGRTIYRIGADAEGRWRYKRHIVSVSQLLL